MWLFDYELIDCSLHFPKAQSRSYSSESGVPSTTGLLPKLTQCCWWEDEQEHLVQPRPNSKPVVNTNWMEPYVLPLFMSVVSFFPLLFWTFNCSSGHLCVKKLKWMKRRIVKMASAIAVTMSVFRRTPNFSSLKLWVIANLQHSSRYESGS